MVQDFPYNNYSCCCPRYISRSFQLNEMAKVDEPWSNENGAA